MKSNSLPLIRNKPLLSSTHQATINDVKKLLEKFSSGLPDFTQAGLQNILISNAGKQLNSLAISVEKTISEQVSDIAESSGAFSEMDERMSDVQKHVFSVQQSVSKVVRDAEESSTELRQVDNKMGDLEKKFSSIDALLSTIGTISDKTNLLSLNATIEAARAGEHGRSFAVVAKEVKDLAATTKEANEQIRTTMVNANESIRDLSKSIQLSLDKTYQAIEATRVATDNASEIERESSGFHELFVDFRERLKEMGDNSKNVEAQIKEMKTIGDAFGFLIEIVERTDKKSTESLQDPLERLAPLVEASEFNAPERFLSTEPETIIRPDQVLLSATDTASRITFANSSFFEVSGYEKEELIGKPHNLIRHPDMPKTAFADLWSTVQRGKMWQGYVKNKTKQGNSYWVRATVFPCYDGDQISGFISLRIKPDPGQIAKAKEMYRKLP